LFVNYRFKPKNYPKHLKNGWKPYQFKFKGFLRKNHNRSFALYERKLKNANFRKINEQALEREISFTFSRNIKIKRQNNKLDFKN
jgi:hypothetical protein